MTSVSCTATNPRILSWARESVNVDVERAASKALVSVEDVREFEIGSKAPTLAQLRKLADLYRQPIATFFLRNVPASVERPTDFRLNRGPLNRDTLLSIRRARAIQAFSRDLGELTAPRYWVQDSNDARNASEARRWLGFSEETQLSLKDARLAFNWLVLRLATIGVDVLVHKFPSSDAKAYCLAEVPPLIVISSNDPHTGSRLFSLLHELSHLANGNSGLCIPEENLWNYAQERQCDKFAAHFLMPEPLVRVLAGDSRGNELTDRVDELSALIKCSKTALLIRFEELGLTSPEDTVTKLKELRDRPRQKSRGSSSRKSNLLKESGVRFSSQVFDAYSRDLISALDGSRMLNLNQGTFEEVGSQLGRI